MARKGGYGFNCDGWNQGKEDVGDNVLKDAWFEGPEPSKGNTFGNPATPHSAIAKGGGEVIKSDEKDKFALKLREKLASKICPPPVDGILSEKWSRRNSTFIAVRPPEGLTGIRGNINCADLDALKNRRAELVFLRNPRLLNRKMIDNKARKTMKKSKSIILLIAPVLSTLLFNACSDNNPKRVNDTRCLSVQRRLR